MIRNVAHNQHCMSGGGIPPPPGDCRNNPAPPEMSNLEYTIWRDFIEKRCGHYITESRMHFLRQRLWERMRFRGIKKYNDYYQYVVFNPRGQEEWITLRSLLLNKETTFFRHQPSFDALTEHILPSLRMSKQHYGIKMLTMWSAGCSTGQEAYSLAMAFYETAALFPAPLEEGGWGGVRLRVFGSDICTKALEKARSARYKEHELRLLPNYYRQRYLEPVKSGGRTLYRMNAQLRAAVEFGYLHLLEPQTYWISGQDIIFCQNVLIYFHAESRVEVVTRLCQRLNPGGYLFLGPAEVVGLKIPGFTLVQYKDVLIYQRIN